MRAKVRLVGRESNRVGGSREVNGVGDVADCRCVKVLIWGMAAFENE